MSGTSTIAGCVENFLTEKPTASTKEVIEHVKNTIGSNADQGTISRVRKRMGIKITKGRGGRIRVKKQGERTITSIVEECLIKNPQATNEELRKYLSNALGREIHSPLNGTMVKKLRVKITGVSPGLPRAPRTVNRKSKIYQTIWTHPTENLSKESMDMLGSFIGELNDSGRAKFEIIERVNPSSMEVREYK